MEAVAVNLDVGGAAARIRMETHIREINGNWDAGLVLDKHVLRKTFLGNDASGQPQYATVRSEVGTAHFQLKYRGDFSKVQPLAHEVAVHIASRFKDIDFILPMPPSKPRDRQPVTEIARALSAILKVPLLEGMLIKLRAAPGAPPTTELEGKAARLAATEGRLRIARNIAGEGKRDLLILDDIYETGAQMEAATAKLRECEKVGKIYAVALTWK